jgi:hypothetical protein
MPIDENQVAKKVNNEEAEEQPGNLRDKPLENTSPTSKMFENSFFQRCRTAISR